MTVGTYDKPNLDSPAAHKDDAYIGDIHSHPYKIKMGKDARIGPSTGDIDDYYRYRPRKFPLGVNLVMSSAAVFLIVIRPSSDLVGDEKVANAFKIDTSILYEYVYNGAEKNPKILNVLDSVKNSKGGINHWKAQKEVWEAVAPEAAGKFTQANLDMNVGFANLSHHEFYHLADIEKSLDLALLSNAVY